MKNISVDLLYNYTTGIYHSIPSCLNTNQEEFDNVVRIYQNFGEITHWEMSGIFTVDIDNLAPIV